VISLTKEKKTSALLNSFPMSMLPQNSSLVLLALECGIQSVLRTCINQSCVTGEFSDLYDSTDDRLNSLIFYCLCICPQIERG
jgi:hypothetical protein